MNEEAISISEALKNLLTQRYSQPVEISRLVRLTGGASKETWEFVVSLESGKEKRLILRKDRKGSPKTSLRLEADIIKAADSNGVPVPDVVYSEDFHPILGSFMITDKIEGETIPKKILKDERFVETRKSLTAQLGKILAGIHSVNCEKIEAIGNLEDQLKFISELYYGLGYYLAAFDLAINWLTEHKIEDTTDQVLVHGDFRNGNFIVTEDGIVAVLDWEMTHLGDFHEDLGWLCVKAWRFGSDKTVGGFGTVDELIDSYEKLSNRKVNLESLKWWEVLGCLKWGIFCILQTSLFLKNKNRSVELAAIGRRICEQEWDLLSLIQPMQDNSSKQVHDDFDVGSILEGKDRTEIEIPTAVELLEAVEDFITESYSKTDDRSVSYYSKVAANLIEILKRELTIGPSIKSSFTSQLNRHGFNSEKDLALSIRHNPKSDYEMNFELIKHLVTLKMAISHPGYDNKN